MPAAWTTRSRRPVTCHDVRNELRDGRRGCVRSHAIVSRALRAPARPGRSTAIDLRARTRRARAPIARADAAAPPATRATRPSSDQRVRRARRHVMPPPARAPLRQRACARGTRPTARRRSRRRAPTAGWLRMSSAVFCSTAASRSAASRPASAARPPVTSTTPRHPGRRRAGAGTRPAIDWWMPLRMFGMRDAARDHVDHVGLGEHRADRRARLGLVGLQRERRRSPRASRRGSGDVLEELARARRALAGHPVAEHLAALVHARRRACAARRCRSTARASGSRNSPPRAWVVMP